MLNMNDLGCLNYLEQQEREDRINRIVAVCLKNEKDILKGEAEVLFTDVTDKDIEKINDKLLAAGSSLHLSKQFCCK